MIDRVYKFIIDHGICSSCRMRQAREGTRSCEECVKRRKMARHTQTLENMGNPCFCIGCRRILPLPFPKKRCPDCLLIAKENAKKYYKERTEGLEKKKRGRKPREVSM